MSIPSCERNEAFVLEQLSPGGKPLRRARCEQGNREFEKVVEKAAGWQQY